MDVRKRALLAVLGMWTVLGCAGLPSELDQTCWFDDEACANRSLGVLDGKAPDELPENAVAHLDRLCQAGMARACFGLGLRFARGEGVVQAVERADRLLGAACAQDYPESCFEQAYLWGEEDRDLPRAADLYTPLCERGEVIACTNLGYVRLRQGAETAEVAVLYRKGCDGGSLTGCRNLGLLLRDDAGDYLEAAALFEKVCDTGDPKACMFLAELLFTRRWAGTDPVRGRALVKRACQEQDHADSCLLYGRALVLGTGGPVGVVSALEAFEGGCALGSGEACNRLGVLLDHGEHGITPDRERAQQAFEKGCEHAYGLSCRNRSLFGAESEKESWLQRACDLRHGPGCAQLGKLRQQAGDTGAARDLYARACGLGEDESCRLAAALTDGPD